MADNTELTAGSGGDTIATDDIAGVKHQRVKVQYGDDGSATDVSDTNPLPVDDAGGSLSVDDGGSSLSIDDGGNTITVDGTVAVTGVATAANQTTLIGHVDGVEGLLTTIDADTGSIATSATTLAGAVAGTEMQVDVVTMPTTTVQGTVTANLSATDNAVLDDIAADTEAIKTAVEGTLTVTGGGGGTEYTVDAAAPAAPVGTASLMERDDALSALTEVEGDWTNMRANANGALWTKHDGEITAALSATDNAVLDAIETDTTTIAGAVSGTEMQVDVVAALPAGNNNIGDVDVASSALPTGASTAANQTTIIGHVDGIEGLLTTIDADTSNLSVVGGGTEAAAIRVTLASDSTGVLSVDDNGSALTVDGTVTANLAAGTNNIGDVDVLSVVPGTGATNLGKAEDAAHTTGDTGVMSLAVRLDSGASLADTDGDYAPLQVDSSGALRVTGGGGGTEYTVDAAAPAAPVGTASLMERDDALSALTEVEGDWTNMRSNANGALWVKHDGTVTVDGSGVTQPVSGTVSVTGVATAANQTTIIGHVDGIEGLLTTIDGDTGTLAVTGGGTETGALRVTVANNSTGVLSVDDNGSTLSVDDGGASLTVDYATTGSGTATGALRVELPTNGTGVIATVGAVTAITNALPAGTNAIGKLAANSGVDIGDVDVTTVGTVTPGTAATSLGKAVDSAAGATDTGVAGLLVRDDALATLTPADGDYTHGRTNLRGAQWMQLDAAPTGSGVSVTNNIDVDETEDAIKASAGTLWGYYVANLSASTMFVKLYNDTVANVTVGTTAPLLTLPVPAGAAGHVALPHGIPFSAAITVAATTGIANSDTGAPSANDVVFNAFYT